jgi:phage/plasmid-like protein (TIGR03299 family)
MAYTGKTPWHKLGVAVDHPMTAAEAIEQAGLDWEVIGTPVRYMVDDALHTYPERQVLVRADNNFPLQTCSNSYKIVQNREAFNFFDGVVGAGEAVYETAGSLKGGRRIWIMAKLPGTLEIGRDDLVEKFILLANSHDGSMQVTMKLTPIRVVCDNTLSAAIDGRDKDLEVRLRHTGNILNRMESTRRALGLTEAYFALFAQNATRMTEKKISEAKLRDMAAQVFQFNPYILEKDGKDYSKLKLASTDRVVALFSGDGLGSELHTSRGTVWGAYNAFTQYIDNEIGVSGSRGKTPDKLAVADNRLNSTWFGRGQEMRQVAWDSAMALVS